MQSFSVHRREFILGGMLAATTGFVRNSSWAADRPPGESTPWTWKLLSPHEDEPNDRQPVPRDPWNAMLAYNNGLYLFGGAYPKYGPPRGPGDLKTLGGLNDLWCYDLEQKRWELLEADDGQSLFDAQVRRPCGRVLPAWTEVAGQFYLFGGLTIRQGWKTRLINDLWQYDPRQRTWTLLEADDSRWLTTPTFVDSNRPTTLAAMGTAAIGQRIYCFGGWGGEQPSVVLSRQLWAFDVEDQKWELLGDGTKGDWPPQRYCPAMTAWQGKLYLWGGRDSVNLNPQFFNDLWIYDPVRNKWEQLATNRPGSVNGDSQLPTARYAMGESRIDNNWYIFGGFGTERGNSPQLNDLWRLNLESGIWQLIQSHNGAKDVSIHAACPAVGRVPAMTSAENSLYLFGGLDLTSGADERGPLLGFNDLWQGKPGHA